MDYNQTLNLPKTDFPMRAGLPKREPEFLARWEANDQYKKLMDHNDGKPLFVLHDGPHLQFDGLVFLAVGIGDHVEADQLVIQSLPVGQQRPAPHGRGKHQTDTDSFQKFLHNSPCDINLLFLIVSAIFNSIGKL